MDFPKGVWLLPTRRRIENLRHFFEACHTTGVTTRGIIIVMKDEYDELRAEYDALPMPDGWGVFCSHGDKQGDKIREVLPHVIDSDWVGLLGDDCVPATPGWDKIMVGSLYGWDIVSCNDCWQAPQRLANCWVWSGPLLRAVGYAFPLDLNHLYADDVWETLARRTGCWNCRMDVVVKHNHATISHTEDDTHQRAYSDENWAHDTEVFQRWTDTMLEPAVAAIEALKAKLGVERIEVNMDGKKVMICTPSAQSKFCTDYVMSLLATLRMFQEKSISYKWIVEGGNSDICAARNELLAVFLYSDFTHMLFIDDDMGWDPQAVSRLFFANKDFVSVAGRKKRDTEIYALNLFKTTGDATIPVKIDQQSWTAEAKSIGMAFTLLTRNCIETMIESYPDLRYPVPGEPDRYALFMPLIEDGLYNAEDYSFCARWRAIGGKVHVCPDVPLKHIGGQQVYEGAWTNVWVKSEADEPVKEAAE